MKRNILLLTLFVGLLACGQTVMAQNSTKQIAQFNHVMKGLKLDKATKDKFRPILIKYYDEIASVKKSHSALKDKYQQADDQGKLTDEQCDLLFNLWPRRYSLTAYDNIEVQQSFLLFQILLLNL